MEIIDAARDRERKPWSEIKLAPARYWERAMLLALIACGVFGSYLVFRPDRRTPFDFEDFAVVLPFLTNGSSFTERFHDLSGYFAQDQGIVRVVLFALSAAKWSLWGDRPDVWQLFRFATMWLVIALTYILLRRLGLRRFAAMVGASLFLAAPPAVDGWLRLHMGEPLGTVLVLVACLLAVSDKGWSNKTLMGIALASLAALVVLTKEMMVVALVLPLGLAAIRFSATPSPEYRQRWRVLSLAMAIGVAVTMIPVGIVALQTRSDTYVAFFGRRIESLSDVIAQWIFTLLPFGVSAFPGGLFGIALLAFAALIIGAWTVRLRLGEERRRSDAKLLVLSVLFPLVGALEYLPWPFYSAFYAIPFQLGGSILIGCAYDTLLSRGRLLSMAVTGIWLAFIFFPGAEAWGTAERMTHRRLVNRSLVDRAANLSPTVDSIFFATDVELPAEWRGTGPTLQRYGEALGNRMPAFVDIPCQTARDLPPAPRRGVIFYSSLCPHPVTRDPIVQRFRRLTPDLRLITDSLRVDVVSPASASSRHGETGTR